MDGFSNGCSDDIILSETADVVLPWLGVGVTPSWTLLLGDDDVMRSSSLPVGEVVSSLWSGVGLVFDMSEASF